MERSASRFQPYLWDELGRTTAMPSLPPRALVLDCAAGDGSLLQTIRRATPDARLYGLEQDSQAAAAAQSCNLRVIVGSPGRRISVERGAFSLVFLPALTDHEDLWCQWARGRLVPGGTLLAAVYPERLSAFVRATQGFEWRGARIYGYGSHSKRVIVGLTMQAGWRLTPATRRLFTTDITDSLSGLAVMRQASLSGWSGRIDAWDQLRFPVRSADVVTFETRWQDAAAIDRLLQQSSFAHDALQTALSPQEARHSLPPLPLKAGHLALQLVTGAFDGPVGTGEHRHVVRGRVVRRPVVTEEEGPDGPVSLTADRLHLEITAIDRTGTVIRYVSAEEEG